MGESPMFYKNGVLLDLFLYSTFFSFYKKQRKVFFISLHARFSFYEKHSKSIFHFFARTKKRNKEMRRLKRRRTANAA
jgi:hypothetical protein